MQSALCFLAKVLLELFAFIAALGALMIWVKLCWNIFSVFFLKACSFCLYRLFLFELNGNNDLQLQNNFSIVSRTVG